MRNKTHLLLIVKIQKFTTYAPFLPPLFRMIFHAKTDQLRCQSVQVLQNGHFRHFPFWRQLFLIVISVLFFSFFFQSNSFVNFFANKKAPAFVAGVD